MTDARIERPGLSQEEIRELREAFNLFDTNGSGSIDPAEIRGAMAQLKYEEKNPLAFQILSNLDENGKEELNFDEFLDLMCAKMVTDQNSREDMLKVFSLFDGDRTGSITVEDLRRIAFELGEEMSEEELQEMVERADNDGDGLVGPDDFVAMMMKKSY